MNNEKFSLQRILVGILIGFTAVAGFSGVGRLTQANLFNNMFAWVLGNETETCYYDMTGAYVCGDNGTYGDYGACYDSMGNYICGDNGGGYDDYYDDYSYGDEGDCYYDSTGTYVCGDGNYYNGEEGCYYDSTGIYVCGDGEYNDSYSCYDSTGNYTCEDDETYDNYEDNYEDEYDYNYEDECEGDQCGGEMDEEWKADEMENMAEMLEESEDWAEDIGDAAEEATDWLEDITDRQEDWQEELDENAEDDYLADEQVALLELAIAYCETAYPEIEDAASELTALIADAEESKQAMEDAYTAFVAGGSTDSSAFWTAQSASGVNDWRDVWRSKAEMYGRLVNYYDFLMEAGRIETESDMTVEEIGGEFAEAVAYAETALSTVPTLLDTELDTLIANAEAEIAAGEEAWRVIDDIRDFFDDLRDDYMDDKDMWDSMESGWDMVKLKEMQNFMTNELAMIKEDIAWVGEELDELEGEGKDVSEARAIIEEVNALLAELEVTTDAEEMEDLFKDLEQMGKKAEKEMQKLGIEFGKYDREVYAETIDVNDPDALLALLQNVPDSVLEQVIEMLLNNVTSEQIETFIEYGTKYEDIGFFDSASIAYMDEDTLDAMIEDKLAILEELDGKIAERTDELNTLINDLASYNFYGDTADQAVELIANLAEEGEGVDIEEYQNEIDDLKEEAREEKYDDGIIPFMDVDDDQWYTSYVWDVKEDGYVGGYKDAEGELTGYYGPSDNVTVGEILKMTLEASDEGTGTDTP
ncbi:MAG: hypothetical protein UW03_C0013G0023, partial [Candidatus Peregrinibacteria bacterium GW2011_GWA2_43_8]